MLAHRVRVRALDRPHRDVSVAPGQAGQFITCMEFVAQCRFQRHPHLLGGTLSGIGDARHIGTGGGVLGQLSNQLRCEMARTRSLERETLALKPSDNDKLKLRDFLVDPPPSEAITPNTPQPGTVNSRFLSLIISVITYQTKPERPMIELPTAIPDVDVLLALEPEELAAKVLFLLRKRQEAMFNLGNLRMELGMTGHTQYPRHRLDEVDLALAEAFAWLEAQGLLVPAEGMNGNNGFRHLSRRAQRFENEAAFTDYQTARLLPKELLHPAIATTVWLSFMRGAY